MTKISALTDAAPALADEIPAHDADQATQALASIRFTLQDLMDLFEANIVLSESNIADLQTYLLASAKTGADTGVVSGTAGSAGQIAYWNADGDLVAKALDQANLDRNLGKQTIWIPAVAMSATTTSGAASGSVAIGTSLIQAETWNFDGAAEEFVCFAVYMPKSWNAGTLTAQFIGSQTGAATNFGVVWGIEAFSVADDEAMTVAGWGDEVPTTDTYGTADDLYISAESTAITVGSTPAAEQVVYFRVTRVIGAAGDTMTTADARLHGVRILFTVDQGTDD